MRRFFCFFILLFSLCWNAFSQSYNNGYQTFKLVGAEVDDDHTYVLVDVTVQNNRSGWFAFSSEMYLLCGNRKYFPTHCYVDSVYEPLDSRLTYASRNSGSTFNCKIVFARIPIGCSSLVFVAPGAWSWGIEIKNNTNAVPKTSWTRATLRSYYSSSNSLRPIEGIYDYLNSDDSSYEYNLSFGVIKSSSGYDIIFLNSPVHTQWKEGELKATMQATASSGVYKISNWYLADKIKKQDFYATLEEGAFVLLDNIKSKATYFAKTYPSFEDNNQNSVSTETNGNNKQYFASGTGFIIDPSGFIATNYHVIDGAKGVDVFITKNGKTNTYSAKSIVVDKSNDLAIIKVNDSSYSKLPSTPYVIGSGTKDVGTSVFAMGYPELSSLGEEIKVTDGIISSKTGYQGDVTTYQISAPIQHGNSGGPLFDKKGNIIGITNAGVTELQNVGYAIKVSYLNNLIDACPEPIHTSSTNQLSGLSFPEMIKKISPYVVIIKIY